MDEERELYKLCIKNHNYDTMSFANVACLRYVPDMTYANTVSAFSSIPVRAYAERLYDKSSQVGMRTLETYLSDDEELARVILELISESYDQNISSEVGVFTVDYRLLNNNAVLDFLSREHDRGNIHFLRIIGNNYTLDEDTYNKISYMDYISTDNSSIDRPNIVVNPEKYLTIYGFNEDSQIERDYIIKEDLTDEEINELVELANNSTEAQKIKISIRFYNPARAVELVDRLDKAGLNKDFDFEILGYTLTENPETYERLEEINKDRNIKVTYTCCHDLLNDYCHEPFHIANSYMSELEPGTTTSLELYLKVLRFAKNFEEQVKGIDSNIEKTMMAYKFLNDNYHYALNQGSNQDAANTRDLDKIMDKDDIVCVGYANLLCFMCRRVGIPMFTYGAPNHLMNVARIIEKDKNGNVILDKICTFDPTNDCGIYYTDNNSNVNVFEIKDSYTYFGLDPEKWLHDKNPSYLTTANSLALPPSEYDKYSARSHDNFEVYYSNNYMPDSYRYSMLHLMGYNYDDNTNESDVVSQLQEDGRIGEIPKEMILSTARKIERKNHPEMSDEEFENHMRSINERIQDSFDNRESRFTNAAPIIDLNYAGPNNFQEVDTYHERIDSHKHIDLDSIDIGPVPYQDLSDLPTGDSVITADNNVEHDGEENVIERDIPDEKAEEINRNIDVIEEKIKKIKEKADGSSKEVDEELEELERELKELEKELDELEKQENEETEETSHENGEERTVLELSMFTEQDFSEGYIAGTTIRKPRYRGIYETDEEYVAFLKKYYDYYFPNAAAYSNVTYHMTKENIIQDLPIYSKETQSFKTIGMTDEEIKLARIK